MLRYLIYTTTSSSWYQEQANQAAFYLSQTKGRGKVEIDVVSIRAPRDVQTLTDREGDTRIMWDWFQQQFPKKEYDGVGFHFTPYYKRKWGLTKNGSKHSQNKDYPEFWICCEKEEAKGYTLLSNFVRLVIHEVSHFDEDLDDGIGNKLTQESVHRWDYEFKAIHHYPKFVDYRGYIIRRKVNKAINDVINFVRKAL